MKRLFPLAACLITGAAVSHPVLAQTVTTVAAPATALPAGIAADVNGEKIQLADLNRMVDAYKQEEPALATGSAEAQKALVEIRRQFLDNLIDSRLLAQEAKRRKIAPKQEDVDASIESVRTGFKTEKEYTAWLAKDGKSEADLKRVIGDELAIRELSKTLTADIVVSGDDIGEYYRANLDKFKIPETVTARHILLAVNPNSPPAEKERVKKRALDLIKQLKGGADFATVAKNNSDDAGTKDDGGNLGEFPRGAMVKPFEDAAFAANKGDIVGPVESQFGIHIIRVDAKAQERTVPLSEIQNNPNVKALLLRRKVQKRLDDVVAQLHKSAKITRAANL